MTMKPMWGGAQFSTAREFRATDTKNDGNFRTPYLQWLSIW